MLRPFAFSANPNRSKGGKAADSPWAIRCRARGIQLVSSASTRCPTTSKLDHVSGPSFSCIHGSGSPRSKTSSTTGVRRSRVFTSSRSSFISRFSLPRSAASRAARLAGVSAPRLPRPPPGINSRAVRPPARARSGSGERGSTATQIGPLTGVESDRLPSVDGRRSVGRDVRHLRVLRRAGRPVQASVRAEVSRWSGMVLMRQRSGQQVQLDGQVALSRGCVGIG